MEPVWVALLWACLACPWTRRNAHHDALPTRSPSLRFARLARLTAAPAPARASTDGAGAVGAAAAVLAPRAAGRASEQEPRRQPAAPYEALARRRGLASSPQWSGPQRRRWRRLERAQLLARRSVRSGGGRRVPLGPLGARFVRSGARFVRDVVASCTQQRRQPWPAEAEEGPESSKRLHTARGGEPPRERISRGRSRARAGGASKVFEGRDRGGFGTAVGERQLRLPVALVRVHRADGQRQGLAALVACN